MTDIQAGASLRNKLSDAVSDWLTNDVDHQDRSNGCHVKVDFHLWHDGIVVDGQIEDGLSASD